MHFFHDNIFNQEFIFQAILSQTKCFKCDCQRCQDPKELGTNLSALKCKNKSAGCLEIVNPIDSQSLDSDFVCDTCQFVISSDMAKMMQDTGYSLSEALILASLTQNMTTDCSLNYKFSTRKLQVRYMF